MIKKCIAVAMVAAIALMCTACGSSSGESADSSQDFTPRLDTEEEVTVNIVGCLANFESLEAVITDFEEYYPNCSVIYTQMADGEEYWNTLKSRLKSDDSVGIFMMQDGLYTVDFVKESCMDLSEEDIDLSAIQDAAISSSTVDEKLYQIPIAHNTSGLIVNKTLLEEHNLDIPTNYDEFLDTCDALKQAGYTPLQGYSYVVNDFFLHSMGFVLMNNAFEDNSDALEALEAGDEGSAEMLQPVFDTLNTFYKAGYIDKEVNDTYEDSYNYSILEFFEGEVPFLVGTTETFSGMKKRETKSEHFSSEPFEYAFMTTPLGEDGSYCYLENWWGFSVNENCPDNEWAVEFLRFLSTEEEINELAYIKGLPSVAKTSDDDRFIGIYTEDSEYCCTADAFFPTTIKDALFCAELDLANGEIDVDEAVSEVERRIREEDFE